MFGAMKKEFIEAFIKHCFFHLCKNAWVQVQKKLLLPVYGIPKARVLLRSFPALAFLPSAEVHAGYEELCQALTKLVEEGTIGQTFVDGINRMHAGSFHLRH